MGRGASAVFLNHSSFSQIEAFELRKKIISKIVKYMDEKGISYLYVSNNTGISYPTVKRILDIGREEIPEDTGYDFQFSYLKRIIDCLRLPVTILDGDDPVEVINSHPNENDLSLLRRVNASIPEGDYYSRIISLFPLISDFQQKVVIDLISCYFKKQGS